jgi:hypothetical protein
MRVRTGRRLDELALSFGGTRILVSTWLAVYLLLGAQALVFAAALASGTIPDVVALAFRALLTL